MGEGSDQYQILQYARNKHISIYRQDWGACFVGYEAFRSEDTPILVQQQFLPSFCFPSAFPLFGQGDRYRLLVGLLLPIAALRSGVRPARMEFAYILTHGFFRLAFFQGHSSLHTLSPFIIVIVIVMRFILEFGHADDRLIQGPNQHLRQYSQIIN